MASTQNAAKTPITHEEIREDATTKNVQTDKQQAMERIGPKFYRRRRKRLLLHKEGSQACPSLFAVVVIYKF